MNEKLTLGGDQFNPARFLVDALFYNAALSVLLIGSLYSNAEMWVGDYPPDIRQKFGPPGPTARRQGRLLAIPFFAIILGGVIWSNRRLRLANGGHLSLAAAFRNTYLLFLSFWLVDLTILDWLFFVTIRPDFIILPGTEGMAGYDDYGFHLRAAAPALIWMIVPASIIGWLSSRKGPF